MSEQAPPTPPAPGTPTTGDVIGQDIGLADAVITPFVTSFNPVIGAGVHLALNLLSVAEPLVYAAVVATLQGIPLTPEQDAALKAAEKNLEHPETYFA